MAFKHFFLLYLIDRFNGERSLSGIYHLLRGKRTAQTIQDSVLFHVEPFFHLLDEFKRSDMDRLLSECRLNSWVTSPDDSHFRLSADGRATLLKLKETCHFPVGITFVSNVNGEKMFWLRLQLLVQTLSELIHHQSAFLPITNKIAVTESIKTLVRTARLDRYQLSEAVFQDLFNSLSECPAIEARILVRQLSGFRKNGLTLGQLSYDVDRDPYEIHCLFKSCLRRMLHGAAEEPDSFPWLARLLPKRSGALSASADSTRRYLKQCLTLAEIAQKRQLAIGTIEDHVVEIALKVPEFDVGGFVSDDIYRDVRRMITRLSTRRLKPLKDAIGGRASYFQIRLVLAKEMIER